MVTVNFEATEAEARALLAWAAELDVAPAALLRDALRRQLARLATERSATLAGRAPSDQEQSPADAADWGRAEDWSDWADAER